MGEPHASPAKPPCFLVMIKTVPKQFLIRDLRNGEWFWIHKYVIETCGAKIGPNGIAVYNALCYFANHKSQKAFPALDTIGELIGVTRPTVIKYLDVLEKEKLIGRKKRGIGAGRGNVNEVYILKKNVKEVSQNVNDVSENVKEVYTNNNNNKNKNKKEFSKENSTRERLEDLPEDGWLRELRKNKL